MTCLVLSGAGARAETLAEAAAQVYRTNPDLRAAREEVLAISETYIQARAGWGPSVNGVASLSHESDAPTVYNGRGEPSPFNASSVGVTVNQPLYTGGRTLAAVREAKSSVLAGLEKLRSREQATLLAAATAYADLRLASKMVDISRKDLESLKLQLRQTEEQLKAGDTTRTDVAQARTRVAQAEADLSGKLANYEVAVAAYANLVGARPKTLEEEPSLARALPASLDEAFTLAERYSPDIGAAQRQADASQAAVEAAKAQRRPYVYLQGSLGYGGSAGANGNAFTNDGRQFTGSLNVNMPLFAGGATVSQIRQASHTQAAAQIQVESQRRATVYTVARAWSGLQLATANIATFTAQVEAASQAAEGARKEQQAGFRETIEVLNADLELRNAQLNLAQAQHDAFVSQVSLLADVGRLDLEVLAPGAPRTDMDRTIRRAGRQAGWTPWEEVVGLIDHVAEPDLSMGKSRPRP